MSKGVAILCFSRFDPLISGHSRDKYFTCRGEYILERNYHDDPTLVQKVRYYVEDGELKCEPFGEETRFKGFTPRRRGEGKTGWIQ